MSHAAQEAKALVFLPDGKKGALDVHRKIGFRVKVVPAGQNRSRLVIKESQAQGKSNQDKEKPVVGQPV